jgi:hypothetical protein
VVFFVDEKGSGSWNGVGILDGGVTVDAGSTSISGCWSQLLYALSSFMSPGFFFRLQNTEGLTLVGVFMEGTTLTCLETYFDAKKRTLYVITSWDKYVHVFRMLQCNHMYVSILEYTPRM